MKKEEGSEEQECAVVEWRQAPPGVDINACIRERAPEDAPSPAALRRAGHPIRNAVRWMTDTGAAIRKRLTPRPSMAPLVHLGPYASPLSGTTRLAVAGFLLVEIVLLWGLQN